MLRAKFKAELRRRAGWGALGLSLLLLVGCTSMVSEGTGAAAGVAGVAIANQITDNAAAATGIGLGVQAAAKALSLIHI